MYLEVVASARGLNHKNNSASFHIQNQEHLGYRKGFILENHRVDLLCLAFQAYEFRLLFTRAPVVWQNPPSIDVIVSIILCQVCSLKKRKSQITYFMDPFLLVTYLIYLQKKA